MGKFAYKLKLPPGSKIHPVLHASNFKKKLGQQVTPQTPLPHVIAEGIVQAMPVAILDCRLVKCYDSTETEVLVQWQGTTKEEAT